MSKLPRNGIKNVLPHVDKTSRIICGSRIVVSHSESRHLGYGPSVLVYLSDRPSIIRWKVTGLPKGRVVYDLHLWHWYRDVDAVNV